MASSIFRQRILHECLTLSYFFLDVSENILCILSTRTKLIAHFPLHCLNLDLLDEMITMIRGEFRENQGNHFILKIMVQTSFSIYK